MIEMPPTQLGLAPNGVWTERIESQLMSPGISGHAFDQEQLTETATGQNRFQPRLGLKTA